MEVDFKKQKVQGTKGNDTINLNDPKAQSFGKKKEDGYVVNPLTGTDAITGSIYNDTISGGAGVKTYNVTGAYGKDTVKLVKGEDLTATVATGATTVSVADNGKDVVATTTDTIAVYSKTGRHTAEDGHGVLVTSVEGTTYQKVKFDGTHKTVYNWTDNNWVQASQTDDTTTPAGTKVYAINEIFTAENGLVINETDISKEDMATLLTTKEIYAVTEAVKKKSWGVGVVETVDVPEGAKIVGYVAAYGAEDNFTADDAEKIKYTKTIGTKEEESTAAAYDAATTADKFTVVTGSITVVNAAKSGATAVNVAGTNVLTDTFNTNVTEKKGKFTGTAYGDIAVAANGKEYNLGTGNDRFEIAHDAAAAKSTVTAVKGEDLTIRDTVNDGTYTYSYDEKMKDVKVTNGTAEVTLKGFAAKDIGATVRTAGAGTPVNAGVIGNKDGNVQIDVTAAEKVTGTWLNDKLAATAAVKEIKLAGGFNEVDFAAGTAQEHAVTLTKGEDLTIKSTVVGGTYKYEYDEKKKDVVVTNTKDEKVAKFTLKGLAAKDLGAKVTTVLGTNEGVIGNKALNKKITVTEDAKGKVTGTWLNDLTVATATTKEVKLAGGFNEVDFDNDNTIKADVVLSKDENLTIHDTDGDGDYTYAYDEKMKDVTVTNGGGVFTLKGFAAKDVGARVTTENGNSGNGILDDVAGGIKLNNVGVANKKTQGKDFKGTWLNDLAVATAGKDDTFKLAGGFNQINETVTSAIGKDVVTLSKGETTNVQLTGAIAGQVTYYKEGNDIVAKVADAGLIKVYTKSVIAYTDGFKANADGCTYKMTSKVGDTSTVYTLTEGQWKNGDKVYKATKGETLTYTLTKSETDYDITGVAGDVFKKVKGKFEVQATDLDIETATTTNYTWDNVDSYDAAAAVVTRALVLNESGTNHTDYYQTLAGENQKPVQIYPDDLDAFNALVGVGTQTVGIGNVDGFGEVVFKGYGKDTTGAAVEISGDNLWNKTINVIATSAKTEGTFGNDVITSDKAKNTFVEKYRNDLYVFGNDTITSAKDAVDTIQVVADGKNTAKLEASDFAFRLVGDTITAAAAGKTIEYTQTGLADKLENLTFQDATNKKYQFYNTTAASYDASSLDKKKYKNNVIAFAKSGDTATIKDSAKNDIIYGGNNVTAWTYEKGGSDQFVGGNAADTYNVTLSKKADLIINDGGNAGDTLNISLDSSLVGKKSTAKDTFIEKGAVSFSVVKVDADTFRLGSDIVITAKDAKSFGQGIEIDNFFKNNVDVNYNTGTGAWTTDFALVKNTGYIETVNVDTKAVGMEAWIKEVAANVAGWLTANEYASTDAVFAAGDKQDIQSLMAVYTRTDATVA